MANAENMKRFRIFSKQNTFSYSNILRTAQDFERVQNVELKLDNDKGADAFVHYNLMYYIAAALMVAVIYSLFDERENGCLLYTSLPPFELKLILQFQKASLPRCPLLLPRHFLKRIPPTDSTC